MKPEGMNTEIVYPLDNLIPEIVSDDNMYESFDYVIDHLENSHQKDIYRPLREKIVALLQDEISRGVFVSFPLT